MTATTFDKFHVAKDHIESMKEVDPEIEECYFFPELEFDLSEIAQTKFHEIRILVVSKQLEPKMIFDNIPLTFGVKQSDSTDIPHKLSILDVSCSDWENIKTGKYQLPDGWTLNQMYSYQDLVNRENEYS